MSLGKVVVSAEEISQVPSAEPSSSPSPVGTLPSPVPWWARFALSAFVLVLPVLCLITIILRIAFLHQPPRVRYAWTSFLSTLLIISGFLTTAAAVTVIFAVPVPAIVSTSLTDLDERAQFPALPSASVLSSSQVSEELKPLVIVVSPATRMWTRQEVASSEFGAGFLIHADKTGYLFVTANHVVSHSKWARRSSDVMVATTSGVWATAHVVAVAKDHDLALLWMPRHSGDADFVQPIVPVQDGENIFVIGHPEGLKFSLSTGIVSSLRSQIFQISAPISPGNSGGPVYDNHGNLIGIVTSKVDDNAEPNAENLGFAADARTLLRSSAWSFRGNGQQLLQSYIQAAGHLQARTSATN